jgi:hypothetical protein
LFIHFWGGKYLIIKFIGTPVNGMALFLQGLSVEGKLFGFGLKFDGSIFKAQLHTEIIV